MQNYTLSAATAWEKYLLKFDIMLYTHLGQECYKLNRNEANDLVEYCYQFDFDVNTKDMTEIIFQLIYDEILPEKCIEQAEELLITNNGLGNFEQLDKTVRDSIKPPAAEAKSIQNKIFFALENTGLFALDGFVKFSMRTQYKHMQRLTNVVINDFLLQQEYNMFLTLMKDLADEQPSRINEIVVTSDAENKIVLLKKGSNKPLDIESGNEFEVCYNDGILSKLLSLSPEKIVIDKKVDKSLPIISTICNVFSDRIAVY